MANPAAIRIAPSRACFRAIDIATDAPVGPESRRPPRHDSYREMFSSWALSAW